jgi:hypothetical protein
VAELSNEASSSATRASKSSSSAKKDANLAQVTALEALQLGAQVGQFLSLPGKFLLLWR